MKLIIAIVPSYTMEKVIDELDKIKVYRKTVSNVLGVGMCHTEVYRGLSETGNLVQKVRFEIAINDELVESVIKAIAEGSQNEDSDGKIFVLNIENCVQLGTGLKGPAAVGQ